MKKLSLLLSATLISCSIQAQTTFNYSGNNNYDYFGTSSKISVIAQNNIVISSPATNHVGLLGLASNALSNNYGVIGTTLPKTLGNPGTPFFYVGVMGDNVSNSLNFNNGYTFGGIFKAKNIGLTSNVIGVNAQATGSNNSTITHGIEALATNPSSTIGNTTIAVRGITSSGTSTVGSYLSGLANPGGYFSSNDGQGIYATTSDGFTLSGFGKISQAVTGYSNITSAYLNAGVVGYSDGTGSYKAGVMGYLGGTAGTVVSYAVYGHDNINASNTYAGYFLGKVQVAGSLNVSGGASISGGTILSGGTTISGLLTANTATFGGAITGTTAAFTGCVTASNITCPSDLRYKKNIVPMENSLSNILKIKGVRYDWKVEEFPEKQFSDKNQIGFIAQEIEKIYPEMVLTDDKGFKSVDYARLTPMLVEAIKELNLRNQKLENRLEKIEEILSVSASKK
jgi:Chaperone of endosialidase